MTNPTLGALGLPLSEPIAPPAHMHPNAFHKLFPIISTQHKDLFGIEVRFSPPMETSVEDIAIALDPLRRGDRSPFSSEHKPADSTYLMGAGVGHVVTALRRAQWVKVCRNLGLEPDATGMPEVVKALRRTSGVPSVRAPEPVRIDQSFGGPVNVGPFTMTQSGGMIVGKLDEPGPQPQPIDEGFVVRVPIDATTDASGAMLKNVDVAYYIKDWPKPSVIRQMVFDLRQGHTLTPAEHLPPGTWRTERLHKTRKNAADLIEKAFDEEVDRRLTPVTGDPE